MGWFQKVMLRMLCELQQQVVSSHSSCQVAYVTDADVAEDRRNEGGHNSLPYD